VGLLPVVALLALAGCSWTSDPGAGPRAPVPATRTAGSIQATPAAPGAAAPQRWVVALGDSYVSGEGARWAANTSGRPGPVDALGPHAYQPAGSAGSSGSSGCDRARISVVTRVSQGLRGANLACSGATTSSHWDGRSFTPGLDTYSDGKGHVGQLTALRRFATHHRVAAVVVSIGGNDFGFGSIVGRCTAAFLETVTNRRPSPCRTDPAVQASFAPARVSRVTRHVGAALSGVRRAMRLAGSGPSTYAVVVEGYPSPLPQGPRIRYREDLLHRLVLGGCPLFDVDATWADRVVLPTINAALRRAVGLSGLPNVSWLDLGRAFEGHRLCETGSAQLQETGLGSWRSPGARARLEWVNMLYIKSQPWRGRESLHPNYWGVLAERRCLRSALAGPGGAARSGSCRDGRFSPTP
jgi:lysophospholipase L1-like esterase